MARRKPLQAKVDANQAVMVEALRAAGASVMSLAKVSNGCPDLVVGFAGLNLLVEVKVLKGKLNPKPAALTPAEEKFKANWQGPLIVATEAREVAGWFVDQKVATAAMVALAFGIS